MVTRSIWRPLLVFAVVLVLLAGFCQFEAHHGSASHGGVSGVCLGMLAASVAIAVLVGLLLSGWVPALPSVPVSFTSLFVLERPPKTAFAR